MPLSIEATPAEKPSEICKNSPKLKGAGADWLECVYLERYREGADASGR